MPDVVRWLRENGRYLSPNDAGDLLQAGAGLLRNWIAIQIVLLSFFVMLFLAGQLVGGLVAVSRPMWSAAYMAALDWYLPGRALVWWSPYITLWLLPFVVGAIPLGWAYWMIGRVGARGRFYERPVTGLVVSAVLTLMLAAGAPSPLWRDTAWGLLGVEALTAFAWAAAYGHAARRARAPGPQGLRGRERPQARGHDLQRRRIAPHAIRLAQSRAVDVGGRPCLRAHRHRRPNRLPRGRLRSAPEPASVDGLRPLGPGRAGRTRTEDHRPFGMARGRAAPRPAPVHRGDHAGPAHRRPPAHPHRCRVARHRVELQDSRLRALVLVGRAGPALRESPRDVRRPVCPRAGLARSRALLPPVRGVLAFSQRLLAAVLVQRPPHPRLSRSVEPAACRSHQPESHARPPGGQHGSGQLLSEPRSGKRRQDAAAPPDQRHHQRDRRRQVPDRAAGSQGRRARHRPPVFQRRRPTPRGLREPPPTGSAERAGLSDCGRRGSELAAFPDVLALVRR